MHVEDEQDTPAASEEFSEVEWLGPCRDEAEAAGKIQGGGTLSRGRGGQVTIKASLTIPDGFTASQ
jgi:hypothetical protein